MLKLEFRHQRRSKAFTEHERLHLYQCIVPDLDIIDSKAMDSVTVMRKSDAWRRVTVKYNSDPGVCERTTEQLKKCFENAKCRRQWVVDSGTGILQPSPTARAPSKFSEATKNGASAIQGDILNFEGYEQHPDMTQQFDGIKCELVDLAENSQDFSDETEDPPTVAIVKTQQALRDSANQFIPVTGPTEYRGGVLLEERLSSSSNLEDVSDTIFLEQSIYRPAETSSGPYKRPRPRSGSREVERSVSETRGDPAAKVAKSPKLQVLEERLLEAQVREAEANASAAEIQLQLNQLALEHARAEEERRKQLHSLRVRRLTQLVTNPLTNSFDEAAADDSQISD